MKGLKPQTPRSASEVIGLALHHGKAEVKLPGPEAKDAPFPVKIRAAPVEPAHGV